MTFEPLAVDLYVGDGRKDWKAFCAAGRPWHFVIWKASQGARYRYDSYVTAERRNFLAAAGDSYGHQLFDGFYDYLDLSKPGDVQAEFFVRAVEAVGGEKIGTLWGMVDVERGGQTEKNPSRALVEDRVSSWTARYRALTGRSPTLYGGELLRSLGISSRLGCGRSVVALYGSELHGRGQSTAEFLRAAGTDSEHLLFWQIRGAETPTSTPLPTMKNSDGTVTRYPTTAPGCGLVDISVLTLPGGLDAVQSQLWAEAPASSPPK